MEMVGWSYEGLKHGFGSEARVANESCDTYGVRMKKEG